MPDEPLEPGVLAEFPETLAVDAEATPDEPAADAGASLSVRSSGPPADWLEKVRRHAPGLLLDGPPRRASVPDSYPSGAPTVEYDDSPTLSARPEMDRWRFADAEPARHEGRPPLRLEEPVMSARPSTDLGRQDLVIPDTEASSVTREPVVYSVGSDRPIDPVPTFAEQSQLRSEAQPIAAEHADARSTASYAPVSFEFNQSSAARAALSGAGPLSETTPMPERRVEPWPETSQVRDVKPDGPARRRVPRVVAMSRPIRPAGIEWPSAPRSTHRLSAVTISPAARVPEPPAAFGAVVESHDPWPTLPAVPPTDVFEVAAALRERERRARLFREQEGA